MKNKIVSLDKLPNAVKSAIDTTYPHGYDHEVFEFEIPTRNEIYEALRFSMEGINYIIKLSKREKRIDRVDWA